MKRSGGKSKKKLQKMNKKTNEIIRILLIIAITAFLIIYFYRNYDLNKNFDKHFYIQPSNNDQAYYYFEMPDDARDPVFFWRWSCVAKVEGMIFEPVLECSHCRIFPKKCIYYDFNLTLATGERLQEIQTNQSKILKYNNIILLVFGIGCIFCLLYSIWLYKTDPEEWQKTWVGRILSRIMKQMEEDRNAIKKR